MSQITVLSGRSLRNPTETNFGWPAPGQRQRADTVRLGTPLGPHARTASPCRTTRPGHHPDHVAGPGHRPVHSTRTRQLGPSTARAEHHPARTSQTVPPTHAPPRPCHPAGHHVGTIARPGHHADSTIQFGHHADSTARLWRHPGPRHPAGVVAPRAEHPLAPWPLALSIHWLCAPQR